MFGQALRLLAVGEAGQRLGGYVRNLATRYLVLSAAGMAFLGAIVFAILAGFWALDSSNRDPVTSAGIMAAILALVGFLIALIAYGITREKKPAVSVSQVMRAPVQTLQSQIPSVDDVGRQIEHAVKEYGPLRVTAAAAAGGLLAGLIARRYGQPELMAHIPGTEERRRRRSREERREAREYERRFGNGRRYA
jgi:hypothetical protein